MARSHSMNATISTTGNHLIKACLLLLLGIHGVYADKSINRLTESETRSGWELLFDGTDVSPAIVGSFTRAIQPLLLNRCAAGACHGGTQGTEPKLIRGPVHGRVNRKTTLMNLESVTSSVMHNAEDTQALALILDHHNTKENKPVKNKPLLTAREQESLVTWIASLPRHTSPAPAPEPSRNPAIEPEPIKSILDLQTQTVTPTHFTQPQHQRSLAKQPNRLRRLLEQAKNPPQLPLPTLTPGLQLEKLTPEEFPLLRLPFKEKKGTAKPSE